MTNRDDDNRVAVPSRRQVLQCMAWGSAGILWTVTGGVPRAEALEAVAAAPGDSAQTASFRFVQISDSHIGFNKEANPMPDATLRETLTRIAAMPQAPAFVIHTGDVTHLSKPSEFDAAQEIMKASRLETHYVPGEHDTIGDDGKAFFARFGHDAKTDGWYSFDQGGVHFIGLVNVLSLKAGGLGSLGSDQIEWLEADLKGRSAETPIVVFAHMPLWGIYPEWGWGTDDAPQALSYLKRFGSVTVLNGHIHQIVQKVEGNISFQTALSTAYPQPSPGNGPGPGPLTLPPEKLRSAIGLRQIDVAAGKPTIANLSLAG
jgi:3',5'-cyclic-AMP phosphodiesterase